MIWGTFWVHSKKVFCSFEEMGQVGEEKENLRTDHHEYWIRAPPTPDGGGGTPPPFPLSAQSLQLGKTSLGHQSHPETAVCRSIAFAQHFQLLPPIVCLLIVLLCFYVRLPVACCVATSLVDVGCATGDVSVGCVSWRGQLLAGLARRCGLSLPWPVVAQ